jgi:hypothetical protein
MTYERGCGGIWQGLLADGYINAEIALREFKERYGYDMREPATAIVSLIGFWRREYETRRGCTGEPGTSSKLEGEIRRHNQGCHRRICEHYVLSGNDRNWSSVTPENAEAISPLAIELGGSEQNRFAVLALSNCDYLEQCTKEVLQHLGFVVRPKRAYRKYRAFSKAATQLIEDSIDYFEAPCVKLMENLERLGFAGDHGTYS